MFGYVTYISRSDYSDRDAMFKAYCHALTAREPKAKVRSHTSDMDKPRSLCWERLNQQSLLSSFFSTLTMTKLLVVLDGR